MCNIDVQVVAQDFESGLSLSSLGFHRRASSSAPTGCSNSNTAGLAGSTWGVLDSAGFPQLVIDVNLGTLQSGAPRREVVIEFDSMMDGTLHTLMELWASYSSSHFSNYAVVIDTAGTIRFTSTGGEPSYTFAGVYTPNVEQHVKICAKLSTFPDGYANTAALNPDGELHVWINGVLVATRTDLKNATTAWTGSALTSSLITQVEVNPFGKLDNLIIGFPADNTNTPSFSNDPECGAEPSGNNGGPSPGDPGEPGDTPSADPQITQPPWVAACEGGAHYLSAADITPSEVWT